MIPFEDDDDAVRIANNSIYGLSGAVTSASEERALAMARRIRTGTLSVNGGMWFDVDTPFGGYRQSGVGRENGLHGLRGVPRDQGDRASRARRREAMTLSATGGMDDARDDELESTTRWPGGDAPPRVSGGLPLLGHLLEMRRAPIALFQRVRDECGEVGEIRLARQAAW